MWVLLQLFWVYEIVTTSILIKPLQKFGEAAHLVFTLMELHKIFVGQSLTSKFREMLIGLIRSGVHNNMQIKLLTPREFYKHVLIHLHNSSIEEIRTNYSPF